MTQQEEVAKLVAAFDATGVVFHNRTATLAAFREAAEITFNEAGEPITSYDGVHGLHLPQALLRFAFDRKDLVDGRTLPRTGTVNRPGLVTKADFTTVAEKVAFIREHGEDAFSRLPLRPPMDSAQVRTREDFDAMTVAEKSRRLSQDSESRNRLPRAVKPSANSLRRTSKEIMADNLAKHVASRGRLR